MSLHSECLVIGGGLAGSMAALRLAAAGREVVLIERERGPHAKVCGEFLSTEAVEYLRGAGLDPLELGAAHITQLRIASGRKLVETALPFSALSLSRTALDEAMLSRAEARGCRLLRGRSVEALVRNENSWDAQCGDGSDVQAADVFLATGKHDVRGWARPAGVQTDLVGFKIHFRLERAQTAALRGAMEIFLFPGGYGGLALVENDVANLCLVVRRPVLRKAGGWDGLLRDIERAVSLMATRLAGADALWPHPLAISPIPYGYLARRSGDAWLLGDQAAVIPSFTGDGMSIALHSGALAAAAYLAGSRPDAYLHTLSSQLQRGMSIATAISRAIVSAPIQGLAPAVSGFLPPLLRWTADATRIPRQAMITSSRPA